MVIRKQNITKPRRVKSIGPLTTLKRMVTILRELNMGHLKFHPISEPGKKMERTGVNEPDGARGVIRSVVVFHVQYIKEKTLGEDCKEANELWRERNPMLRIKYRCKLIVKPEELHFRS